MGRTTIPCSEETHSELKDLRQTYHGNLPWELFLQELIESHRQVKSEEKDRVPATRREIQGMIDDLESELPGKVARELHQ